jgi:superfamily II DNA/RNA helicase
VGRCGRAGRTGIAHTFLVDGDEALAPPLLAMLRRCRQSAPPQLVEIASAATARAAAESARGVEPLEVREEEDERRATAISNREKQRRMQQLKNAKGRAQQKGKRRH